MRPIAAVAAGLVLTALVSAATALIVLRLDSRTNTQEVNLGSRVTITEESGIVQAAARAKPAVVSVISQQAAPATRGSGYLATTDGYIVTNLSVVADANGIAVLVPADSKRHDGRLVDYDCQTGVAVIKIDNVSGLPTLAFADPTALSQGQVVVAVSGPASGGAITPGYVAALHRVSSTNDPINLGRTLRYSDTIQTTAAIDSASSGGPLLNVAGQVVGIAVESHATQSGFALNVADIQDDVQQILQSGRITVPSLGAATSDITPDLSTITGIPEGTQIVSIDAGGAAAAAGLQTGDIITQIDDVHLDAAHPLSLLLRSRFHANQRVTVTYTRSGSSTQAELTLTSQHPSCS